MIGLVMVTALIVGDSIGLGSASAIQEAVSQPVTVQAVVGRQFHAAPELVAQWTAQHDGPVVVELGANGPIQQADLDAVLTETSGRPLILVGTSVPRPWAGPNNALLRDATRYPGVKFVDWDAIVRSHPGVLGPDGVHPTPLGRRLLASAIAEALNDLKEI